MTLFRSGLRVKTVNGEIDHDEHDEERLTPPGTWGEIESHNHEDHWNVTFPNGAWVILTEAEMSDPKQYELGQ